MASTPPRQDVPPMLPDASSARAQPYSSGPTGVGTQPFRPSTQNQGTYPVPPFRPDQTASYAFRPPPNQGPVYRPPPSTSDRASGYPYTQSSSQPASAGPPLNQPPSVSSTPGSLSSSSYYPRMPAPPQFRPPSAVPSSSGQVMMPQPSLPGQGASAYSKSPITGPVSMSQTVNPLASTAGPFPVQPAILNQPSMSTVGLSRTGQNVPGPFSTSSRSMPINPVPSSGPVLPGIPQSLPGMPVSNQNPAGQHPAGPVSTPVNQPPPMFTSQVSNQMSVNRQSSAPAPGSFSSPPKAPTATPARGPPTFGLPATSAPVPNIPPPLPNSASVGPGFPGQMGTYNVPQGQGLSNPSQYPPAFGSVQSAQYPQYASGAPSLTSDGQLNRATAYPGAAPLYQNVQGLVEEFQSLSMISGPGSMEGSVDASALPRPELQDSDYPVQSSPANCHGRYFQLTCNALPNSQSLAARWHLPLGAVSHPLAEAPLNEEVPVIDFGSSGIIRCRRCRTYINPFAVFTDNGRRWKCNLCNLNNEVPSDYYCPLDQTGRRTDVHERPELSRGSVEFIAPAEYMVRPPMPPVYFFLIDVSFSAIKTGMLQIAVDTIKSCLDKLPGYPRTQIGFLTFDSALHFYSLKSTLTQPQMMVVADLEDPFLPMPDDLLVNLSESKSVVEALLNSLPSMFKDNLNVESAVGPALRSVFMIMSQLGGKLLFFQSSLPSLGVGRLKMRGNDQRVYGTDNEPSLRNPEDPFYKQMAADFSKMQISVNLYAFGDSYVDLASLGTLSKYTAGQVYFYPSFQPNLSGEKFRYELARDLTRETAWEAVLRIRCGKGMRFSKYHGHFMLRSSDLMALPAVDCDKAFAMQLTLDETLLTTQNAYFQSALYTSSNGERRIRVHTAAAPLVSDLNEMYRAADTGAIMMLMSRIALESSLVSKLDDVRQQAVQSKLVRAFREYQNLFGVQHPLTGRLIYPESLKLLPLYCLGLYKCLALRGGHTNATLDERLFATFDMMVMSVPRLLSLLYPVMFRLDEHLLHGDADIKAIQRLPLTSEKLDARGAFLVNDGVRFIIWLGSVLPVDFSIQLLGIEAVQSGDFNKAVFDGNNNVSKRFATLLKSLRSRNPAVFQQCHFVRQGDQPREGFLVLFNMVEDRPAGLVGYADWMSQLFRQVKQKA
ncbi:hypothetical protein KP509_37G019900 [Ceratopteris richardii]|uniref:Uncharacterized protein n=1 Tax=Ceratopteris richardii TaxID=49495 RepID=A0A8T2Q735_CERRI|nr:hypothetical protein KP509_37G019900 [Ceratopteris richardii]